MTTKEYVFQGKKRDNKVWSLLDVLKLTMKNADRLAELMLDSFEQVRYAVLYPAGPEDESGNYEWITKTNDIK